MLKVASISWSFADDIVFSNIGLVLYANGCRWGCPGCHNKQLQCFENITQLRFEDNAAIIAYVTDKIHSMAYLDNNLTLIGSGGDFFFQLSAWTELCLSLKALFPWLKIVWYTGAEHTPENIAVLGDNINAFDAILWGKLRVIDNYVIKKLTRSEDGHINFTPVQISEYNNSFEENKDNA